METVSEELRRALEDPGYTPPRRAFGEMVALLAHPELAERALQLRPRIKTLFMTAYAYDHLTTAADSPTVIRKPFTPDRLLNAVAAHLDRAQPV